MATCIPFRSVVSIAGLAIAFSGTNKLVSLALGADGLPVAMELRAVTLELVCHDGAESGTFRPIHARVLEANTWGGAPAARPTRKAIPLCPAEPRGPTGRGSRPPKARLRPPRISW